MKYFAVLVLFGFMMSCSESQSVSKWKVDRVSTTYVKKGIYDSYEPNTQFLGAILEFDDNTLVISELQQRDKWTAIYQEFKDSVKFNETVTLKRRSGNRMSELYPDDDVNICLDSEQDTCHINHIFFNLIDTETEQISASISVPGEKMGMKLLLIKLNADEMVLYSERDLQLHFLKRVME